MRHICVQRLRSKKRHDGNTAGTFQSLHTRLSIPSESTGTAVKPELPLPKSELCVLAALVPCLSLHQPYCSSISLIDFPHEMWAEDLPSSIFIPGLDHSEFPEALPPRLYYKYLSHSLLTFSLPTLVIFTICMYAYERSCICIDP